ncbi:MAG: cell division control protein Cdc6, partial [Halanaeroarchaeum sp.]
EVLERIAEAVAGQSGDCRQALNQLLAAGRKAQRDSQSQIETEHLEDVIE